MTQSSQKQSAGILFPATDNKPILVKKQTYFSITREKIVTPL
jgi:hypothetical protein